MKPSPRPRKTPVVPKAVGPDPALIGASSSSSSPASAASDTDSASSSGGSARAGTRPRGQLSIWMDADVLGRARTAWRAENSLDQPYCSFGQWIAGIIERAVTDAEKRINNGQPFEPTPPGQIGHSNPHP